MIKTDGGDDYTDDDATVEIVIAVPTPEEPGFEAVLAIAGLLAIAYFVLRKK
jgi:PGF-CTERM protein